MGWESELEGALEAAVSEIPKRVGILFSGGIDSSLLAFLSKRSGKEVHLYSSGTSVSHDMEWAPKAARILGLPIEYLAKSDDEIIEGIGSIKRLTDETSTMLLLIELPLYFISKFSDDSFLASGQGADELFLGYKKYENEDTSREDLLKVLNYIVPLEKKIAESNGKKLIYPYLHSRVMEVASRIPYEQNVRNGTRKYILRSTASRLQLSDEIAWKQKKASQYSSGFKDAVARIAKKENKTVHEFVSEM